jgi:hypothetical protein
MRARFFLLVSGAAVVSILGLVALFYQYPPVYERVDWYVSYYYLQIYRRFNPPEEVRFIPQQQLEMAVQSTLQAMTATASAEITATQTLPPPTLTPLPSATDLPAATFTPSPTHTPSPTPTPTPTITPTAVPDFISLTGVKNEVETRNNCGPATLAMALSYWGWQGNQTVPQAVLRPNPRVDDKNVMPAELEDYVHNYTEMRALVRVGGDLDMMKRLIAAGFPVIVEKGHITTGWIGHYILLTGYDDANEQFITQDSLIVSPNVRVPYVDLTGLWWRHFNYLYLVIFPPEREAEILDILGPHAGQEFNLRAAVDRARQEIEETTGRELFFAWYNLGSSLTGLGDYLGAAAAFDVAYGEVYPSLPQNIRPWRVPWYQTDVYEAYYHTGRYQDVIQLADATLRATGSAILEETFYWRGMARQASGDSDGAIADFRQAYRLNPNSTPAVDRLQELGIESP